MVILCDISKLNVVFKIELLQTCFLITITSNSKL